jgi:hypothetical protein
MNSKYENNRQNKIEKFSSTLFKTDRETEKRLNFFCSRTVYFFYLCFMVSYFTEDMMFGTFQSDNHFHACD